MSDTLKGWRPSDMPDLTGKTIVITGANSGLGFEAAREFAKKNATLILLCRNDEKAAAATAKITAETPQAQITNISMDLSSLASVNAAADEVLALTAKHGIDVLVNNAGLMLLPKRVETADGFEMQMGVNHMGHFLLTQRLFEAVEKAKGRIVILSSVAQMASLKGINVDNLSSEQRYHPFHTYSQSKFANAMFGRTLAEKITAANKNVKVIVVHPGYAKSNLSVTGPSSFMSNLMKISDNIVAQSANKGAWPTMIAATSELAKHGKFYGPKWLYIVGPDGQCAFNKKVFDKTQQDALWEKSEAFTGVTFSV